MRLIDADKIKYQYGGLVQIAQNDYMGIAKYFSEQIDEQPTIDAEPVVHAKWETVIGGINKFTFCSNCTFYAQEDAYMYPVKSKYCPHCGAKMDM